MSQATNLADLKSTSKKVAKHAGLGSVKKFFESQKGSMMAVMPKHMDPDRMLKLALGAMRTTPKLADCTVETLFGAVIQCAQLGLEPNTPLGHAYLIPFKNNRTQTTEVNVIFGYKGLVDLARRSGQIISISAHEVCEKDEFEYTYGLEESLVHKPALGDRGAVIAFYSVAKLVGGGHAFEVMSVQQIQEIRDAAQNYKFAKNKAASVWGSNFVEMGRKTVLRRLFKYLPVSIELATATALDNKSGESQRLDDVLTGEFAILDDEAEAATQTDDNEQPKQIEHQESKPIPTQTIVREKVEAKQTARTQTRKRATLE